MERLTYTVDDTAELLGLGRTATYQAVRSGEIPSIRIGNRILVPKVALESLLESSFSKSRGEMSE